MKKKLFLSCLLMLTLASAVFAQESTIPRMSDGHPDLNGIWQSMNTANWNLEGHAASQGATETLGAIGAVTPGQGVIEGGKIPYLQSALAQRDENFVNRRTQDPEARCYLPGVPRATYIPHPFQIFQTDDEIFVAYQYDGAVRTFFMNDQMEAPVDSWMGWSNGHWEGDTLVVEVAGLNGETWLDRSGNYGSITMKVTERYTLMGDNHIAYEATIEDPNVYERPWKITMPLYRRMEANARLMEFKCVEFAEEIVFGHLFKRDVEEVEDNE